MPGTTPNADPSTPRAAHGGEAAKAIATGVAPTGSANTLGLNYRHEASRLPRTGPIWDVHVHIGSLAAARLFFEVADLFGVQRVWSQTNLEEAPAIQAEFPDRIRFIAIPNYAKREEPQTFTTDFLRRIEKFHALGSRMVKFWSAPRGRDLMPDMQISHPSRRDALKLMTDLGMMLMTHVADPDTWFKAMYADERRYGRKMEQYEPLERLLDDWPDMKVVAAHMAGHPEDIDHIQSLLDRHPNLHVDTSATKWQVRELSKHPDRFRQFVQANPGRVLFGTDIVATTTPTIISDVMNFDLLASRYWAMRTMMETDYEGPSPIVDPDLNMVDPKVPKDATATLRGAKLDPASLEVMYLGAAQRLWPD